MTGVDLDRRTAQLRLSGGATVNLDAAYLEDGHLDHGYALTAHKAQGATVDRAFVLGSDDLYREWGYTALSRHRDEARFYLVSAASVERHLRGLEPDEDPIGRQLVDMLGDSHAKTLALDHVPAAGSDAARDALTRFALLLADEGAPSEGWNRRSGRARRRECGSKRCGPSAPDSDGSSTGTSALRSTAISPATNGRSTSGSPRPRATRTSTPRRSRRDAWLLEHGEDRVSLLLAEDPGCDELRDEIVARLHAEPSVGLDDCDEWSRAAVEGVLDGPELALEPPSVDVDFDLGP